MSLGIGPGECVVLLGANGAGKSTLLLMLAGLLRGDGTIRIDGEVLDSKSVGRLRGKIGIVFEEPEDQLFLPCIFDDVAFGPLNQGIPTEQAEEMAAGMLDVIGLYKIAEKPAHALSHGQKKRAALATALVSEPGLLLLDEPSAGLDPRGRAIFASLISKLTATRVIATHDLELAAQVATRIVILHEGVLVADLPKADFFADYALLDRYGLLPSEAYRKVIANLRRR